jgi:hypothetical protein
MIDCLTIDDVLNFHGWCCSSQLYHHLSTLKIPEAGHLVFQSTFYPASHRREDCDIVNNDSLLFVESIWIQLAPPSTLLDSWLVSFLNKGPAPHTKHLLVGSTRIFQYPYIKLRGPAVKPASSVESDVLHCIIGQGSTTSIHLLFHMTSHA